MKRILAIPPEQVGHVKESACMSEVWGYMMAVNDTI